MSNQKKRLKKQGVIKPLGKNLKKSFRNFKEFRKTLRIIRRRQKHKGVIYKMAKQQTFISIYKNADGKMQDFFRHSLKTANGVIKRERNFIIKEKDCRLFKYLQDNETVLEIWNTPDGYNEETCVYRELVKNIKEA